MSFSLNTNITFKDDSTIIVKKFFSQPESSLGVPAYFQEQTFELATPIPELSRNEVKNQLLFQMSNISEENFRKLPETIQESGKQDVLEYYDTVPLNIQPAYVPSKTLLEKLKISSQPKTTTLRLLRTNIFEGQEAFNPEEVERQRLENERLRRAEAQGEFTPEQEKPEFPEKLTPEQEEAEIETVKRILEQEKQQRLEEQAQQEEARKKQAEEEEQYAKRYQQEQQRLQEQKKQEEEQKRLQGQLFLEELKQKEAQKRAEMARKNQEEERLARERRAEQAKIEALRKEQARLQAEKDLAEKREAEQKRRIQEEEKQLALLKEQLIAEDKKEKQLESQISSPKASPKPSRKTTSAPSSPNPKPLYSETQEELDARIAEEKRDALREKQEQEKRRAAYALEQSKKTEQQKQEELERNLALILAEQEENRPKSTFSPQPAHELVALEEPITDVIPPKPNPNPATPPAKPIFEPNVSTEPLPGSILAPSQESYVAPPSVESKTSGQINKFYYYEDNLPQIKEFMDNNWKPYKPQLIPTNTVPTIIEPNSACFYFIKVVSRFTHGGSWEQKTADLQKKFKNFVVFVIGQVMQNDLPNAAFLSDDFNVEYAGVAKNSVFLGHTVGIIKSKSYATERTENNGISGIQIIRDFTDIKPLNAEIFELLALQYKSSHGGLPNSPKPQHKLTLAEEEAERKRVETAAIAKSETSSVPSVSGIVPLGGVKATSTPPSLSSKMVPVATHKIGVYFTTPAKTPEIQEFRRNFVSSLNSMYHQIDGKTIVYTNVTGRDDVLDGYHAIMLSGSIFNDSSIAGMIQTDQFDEALYEKVKRSNNRTIIVGLKGTVSKENFYDNEDRPRLLIATAQNGAVIQASLKPQILKEKLKL